MDATTKFFIVMLGILLLSIALYVLTRVIKFFEDRHEPKEDYRIPKPSAPTLGTQIKGGENYSESFKDWGTKS